jgi:hypothetical protein
MFPGVKAAGVQGWQPCHLYVPFVMKSGSLNLLEPSGPVKACNGMALPLLYLLNCHSTNKSKAIKQSHYRPSQDLGVPGGWGSQILRQSTHKGGKFVSPTHRPPLPPGNISGTHFCYRLSRLQDHNAAGRIMSIKNSNDTIGNRFRDLPVCIAVPQPLHHRVPRHSTNASY